MIDFIEEARVMKMPSKNIIDCLINQETRKLRSEEELTAILEQHSDNRDNKDDL